MARTKKTARQIVQEVQRLTWTRFHLPKEQPWPRWNIDDTDDLGPLANVPGCLKVSLGRVVEELEQAVLIVLWNSASDLSNFKASPNFQELLHILDVPETRVLSLHWSLGFDLQTELRGRVTLTTLSIQSSYTAQTKGTKDKIYSTFPHLPQGYRDPRYETSTFPGHYQRSSYAWGDEESKCYVFFKWGLTGDREQEETLAGEMKESWAEAVPKIMPPVESWEQERWEIEAAPSYVSRSSGGDRD